MDPITQQIALASAGGKKDPVYVDDAFSTYLYEGNQSNRSINNGIDLSGEGGLVWIKSRGSSQPHVLTDTERGYNKQLSTNVTDGQYTDTNQLSAFNSNGFSLGTTTSVNESTREFVAWTFRKAPGFFDCVTWTGNGSGTSRTFNHNLQSTPALIILKKTSGADNWFVFHKDQTSSSYYQMLDTNSAEANAGTSLWSATNTTFTLADDVNLNILNQTSVAYLFASDDASFGTDGDESIIKCGTYTGNGGSSSSTNDINLGFEPQWILIKSSSNSGEDWIIADTMRGSFDPGTAYDNMKYLRPNLTNAESGTKGAEPTSTGFKVRGAFGNSNGNGQTYIYMAIRRPNKPPELATEVFAMDTRNSTSPVAAPTWKSPFPVDMAMHKWAGIEGGLAWGIGSRLTGNAYAVPNSNAAEAQSAYFSFDWQNGFHEQTGVYAQDIGWMFKRAPGFMDVVLYTGTGSNISIPHNLGTIPEMVIVKHRNASDTWIIYTSKIDGSTDYFYFQAGAKGDSSQSMPSASAINWTGSASVINTSAGTYIAYLFATLPGISKVGSYTGNGGVQTIDCGFTNGARFVLIKQTDGSNDWRVFDTLRGIGAGNDPVLSLNTSAGQDPNKNWLEADSTGFKVNTTNDNVNGNNNSYFFLAIA